MKTKLIKLSDLVEQKKPTAGKKLKGVEFRKAVVSCGIAKSGCDPKDYQNILYIGRDYDYGDVFKAWDENENFFMLYFGDLNDGVIDE